jgi:hypothetical protein
MRTTLTLDEDVFAVARLRAQRERVSLGEAVSRYVREGLRANAQVAPSATKLAGKYSILPARDEIVTTEHIRRLMDQEGI